SPPAASSRVPAKCCWRSADAMAAWPPMSTSQARDLEQLDALVARFFAAFDNREGRAPTLEAIAALFARDAIVARDAGGTCESCTVTEFAEPRVRLLAAGELAGFHEWETEA